jgi:hypothetical protein
MQRLKYPAWATEYEGTRSGDGRAWSSPRERITPFRGVIRWWGRTLPLRRRRDACGRGDGAGKARRQGGPQERRPSAKVNGGQRRKAALLPSERIRDACPTNVNLVTIEEAEVDPALSLEEG